MTTANAAREAGRRRSGPLTVTFGALLHDWRGVYERVRAYLAALGDVGLDHDSVAAGVIEEAVTRPDWRAGDNAHAAALAAARREIVGDEPSAGAPEVERRFDAWRLARALGATPEEAAALPPLARGRFVPHRIDRRGLRRRLVSTRDQDPWAAVTADAIRHPAAGRAGRLRLRWVRRAFWRRSLLLVLILIPTVIASQFMLQVLPGQGRTPLEMAITVFFGTLFGWISIGFWTALAGFGILISRRDRFAIDSTVPAGDDGPLDPRARTAVIMPICAEPVERVFAGLRTIYASLEKTGRLESFDFFVLSDTAEPEIAVREEEAWLDWCREVGGFGRIFYRRRRIRVKRKSGNVADFCRRFGRRYRYMLTLDADSVMSGETIVRLVRLMEENPAAGLIQTAPAAIGARSLYARLQQFANRVYGPLFATGMHYWQLGDAQYWGHNAIVRMAPFLEHCSLPRLPGKPPFGGEILSHDFVEAALLGRAGYSIWLAYGLGGSYEELPSSLLEDLSRDRRWAQGNFQHLRLVFVEGLFHVHRALFVNGVLAYGSALLWFCFLALSTAAAILNVLREPDYFPSGPSLFPQWPIWRPDWALALLTVTLAVLFVPKLLSAILVIARHRGARLYGGAPRFLLSILLEFLASSLFAPIRMLFHTKFVLTNLAGRVVQWKSPPRGENETGWREAVRHHAGATLIGLGWGLGVYWLNPSYAWWLAPILGALVVSVPTSVLMSRVSLGQAALRAGLFVTPEESDPPYEVAGVERQTEAGEARTAALPPEERDGFVRAVVDPYVNALHRWMLRGARTVAPSVERSRRALVEKVLAEGPAAIASRDRRRLLLDPDRLDEIHRRVWEIESLDRARLWGRPGREA